MLVLSCDDGDNGKDATGVFEATEIIVSAEATGKLLAFEAYEAHFLINFAFSFILAKIRRATSSALRASTSTRSWGEF